MSHIFRNLTNNFIQNRLPWSALLTLTKVISHILRNPKTKKLDFRFGKHEIMRGKSRYFLGHNANNNCGK